MAPRDRLEGVAQPEVPGQVRLAELHALASPIVASECRHASRGEPIGQEPRLHRAVTDDPGAALRAPWNLPLRGITADERERRLQRIDVPDRLTTRQQGHVEVRHADRAYFTFVDEPNHRCPGVVDRGPRLVRPMELVEIDPVDA